MNKLRKSLKQTLLILCLICLPPVGVVLFVKKTKRTKKTKIIVAIVALLWTLCLVLAIVNAPPSISMSNIKESGNVAVQDDSIKLAGTILPASAKLLINDEQVKVNADGSYAQQTPLNEGDNTITAKIVDGDKVTIKKYKIHRMTAKERAAVKVKAKAMAEKKQHEAAAKKKAQEAARKKTAEAKAKAAAAKAKTDADKRAKSDAEKAKVAAAKAKFAADKAKKAAETQAKAAADAAARAAAEAAKNAPKTSFGDGIYLVGKEIVPGTYKTTNPYGSCYYARLSGTSGSFGDIIANGNPSGQAIITISASDVAFESTRCGIWNKI